MVKHDGEWLQRLHKASLRDGQQCEVYSTDLRHVIKSHSALVAQLEALRALPPVAYTDSDELLFQHSTSDMWPVSLGFGRDIPLFTAAKPSEQQINEIKVQGLVELTQDDSYGKELSND